MAFVPAAFAQVSPSDLAVSSSGLRLEISGDPQRPLLALHLPGVAYRSILIEMPEHAWWKEKADQEPVWFYKMYSTDPNLHGSVTWSKTADTLSYRMETLSGFTLQSTAHLESDGVAITHTITNPSLQNIAEIQAPTCIKLYRPFNDVFLERTYVHHPNGIELIASETPERLTKNAEEWLPCRYIVRCGNSALPSQLIERVDGITRYHKSKAADIAFIATESNPPGWIVATHGLDCPSVFTNPARTCQHADPQALSIAGGRAILRLKLYVSKGIMQDVYKRVALEARAGRA